MKRVLMVVHSYYKEDTRVRREAQALIRAGYDVDVVCLNKGHEPQNEVFEEVSIYRCDVKRSESRGKLDYIWEYLSFFFGAFAKCSRLAFKHKYRVFEAHNMPNFLVFCGLIPRLRGARVLLDMHDSMPELYVNIFGIKSKWLKRFLFAEEWMSNKFAHASMTANLPIAKLLGDRNNCEFFVLHNTPDPKVLPQVESVELEQQYVRLFHHGNIHRRYGLERILPTLSLLNQGSNSSQFRLEVHGQGPWYAEVQQQATEQNVAQHCDFHGAFNPESIGPHLAQADIGLVLNHKDDLTDLLLPVKMLEYISFRIPVICPRTAAIEDYFDDECVFYFDNDDELEQLVRYIAAHPEEVSQKVEKAYQIYSDITWPREQERFVRFVEAL
ncbi:glycosyltransferase family protein [Paraferrimonas sedimenticola]|uniref:Uncharacterized protein n=1 Tax=Paraferrimonas sedimenticola TaxID=375674 RepID=A0AA37W1T5_9GAMM|nr:glycosyltransferase [Paraferrimonas sedimenticola]GLP96747.1 hypothetical protein GCM10007895_20530 [Paraferrimonas sedimenticola]